MGETVIERRCNAVPIAQFQRSLQRVVIAGRRGFKLVYHDEARKSHGSGGRIDLVDIAVAEEFAALRAHKAHFQCDALTESLLEIQVVDMYIRGAELRVHREYVGR